MLEETTSAAYWAAFGYQNHIVPVARPRLRGKVVGLCGIMAAPGDLVARDGRPTCSVCAGAEREGRYRITEGPVG